jgi:hypothetical protein
LPYYKAQDVFRGCDYRENLRRMFALRASMQCILPQDLSPFSSFFIRQSTSYARGLQALVSAEPAGHAHRLEFQVWVSQICSGGSRESKRSLTDAPHGTFRAYGVSDTVYRRACSMEGPREMILFTERSKPSICIPSLGCHLKQAIYNANTTCSRRVQSTT